MKNNDNKKKNTYIIRLSLLRFERGQNNRLANVEVCETTLRIWKQKKGIKQSLTPKENKKLIKL